MRVVHIIKATQIGGAERHLLILLKALRQRGVEAELWLLVEPNNPMQSMVDEAEQRGIPVERFTIRFPFNLAVVRRLRRHLRQNKPDIVHTHLIHADLHGILAARLAGVRVRITTRHNDDPFRRTLPVRIVNRLLWRNVSAGIAISDALRRFTLKVEGAPPRKLHVIKYGIEPGSRTSQEYDAARAHLLDHLRLPDDTLVLGMACRLVQQKGVQDALRALARIRRDVPQAHLVIAGDGDQRARLEKLAQNLKVADRAHFLGWRDDVPDLMMAFDLFLVPSLWEGFGLVLLEAMRHRLPIIASDVSAIPEVVAAGETGLLVPPASPDALAGAIRTLLSDRVLRAHMGLLAEDRLEAQFSAGRMADETLDLYNRLRR